MYDGIGLMKEVERECGSDEDVRVALRLLEHAVERVDVDADMNVMLGLYMQAALDGLRRAAPGVPAVLKEAAARLLTLPGGKRTTAHVYFDITSLTQVTLDMHHPEAMQLLAPVLASEPAAATVWMEDACVSDEEELEREVSDVHIDER